MSDTPKASGVRGEDGEGAAREPLGAQGGTSQKTALSRTEDNSSRTSKNVKDDLGCQEKTTVQKSSKGASKENIPPREIEDLGRGTGRSTMRERKVLQEKVLTASGDTERKASKENLPDPVTTSPEEKYFKLKDVNLVVTAKATSPVPKAPGEEGTSTIPPGITTIIIKGASTEPPKPKRDPSDNLGNFYQFLAVTSVSDLWAFDDYISRSGAFSIQETEKTKGYKCQERFILPGGDDESDLDMSDELEDTDDFLNVPAGINVHGGALCKGHFKVLKLQHQIYRIKTSLDSLCKKCQMLVPTEGLPPGRALKVLKQKINIEPFLEQIDDMQSTYKMAWIHKRFGTFITETFKDTLTLSQFNDCVMVSVEVSSQRGRRETMFFPFAFLIGNDLSEKDIEEFLKHVIEKCCLAECSYILTSNHHEMFATVCSRCFWPTVKVLPDFFMVTDQLRESWLGRERILCDFENIDSYNAYELAVREALHALITKQRFPNVEKALEHSLGLNYCEISNISKVIKVAEDYVSKVLQAELYEPEHDRLATKEDYAWILEFLSLQHFEAKVRYLDNCSNIRGNHILLMMPDLMSN